MSMNDAISHSFEGVSYYPGACVKGENRTMIKLDSYRTTWKKRGQRISFYDLTRKTCVLYVGVGGGNTIRKR